MIMACSLGGASFFMTQADMITALVVMFHPEFAPTEWQVYLVCQDASQHMPQHNDSD